MKMATEGWNSALSARTDLLKYGDNALGLFSLGLRFNIEDLESVAADAVTDGNNDKKCDLVYIDTDDHFAVVQQCYLSKSEKSSAPANKASDLNTAVGWLLQAEEGGLPERIKSSAIQLRSAIKDKTVESLYIWYVHNLTESKNVADELEVVKNSATSILATNFSASKVRISVQEVGANTIDEWYQESLSPILVHEKIQIPIESGFPVKSERWEAFVTAIPAAFLHKIYNKRSIGSRLFSANVRDYLGSVVTRS